MNRYIDGKQQFEEIVAGLPSNSNKKMGSEEGILEQLNQKDREECLVFYLTELTDNEKALLAKSKHKQYAIRRKYFKVAKRPKLR